MTLPYAEVVEQVTRSQARVEAPWRTPVTARELPILRWRELEIHHVDLATGDLPALPAWPF